MLVGLRDEVDLLLLVHPVQHGVDVGPGDFRKPQAQLMQLDEFPWLTSQGAVTGPDLLLDVCLCQRPGLLPRLEDVREALLGDLEVPPEPR